MKRKIKGGSTSLIEDIFIGDTSSATGVGLSGLTPATSNLVAYYKRKGSAPVAFTLAAPPAGKDAAPALTEFYEKPFTQAGGRRLFWRAGEPQILLEGFDSPHGFAAVVRSSGTSYVLRADGYPDLQVLGALFHLGTPAPASAAGTAPAPAK